MQTPYFNDPQSILFEFNKFATEMVVNSVGTRHAQFSFCAHIANAKYLCWDKIELVVTHLWILLLVVIALKAFTARMHSSRMRTARFGCHHYMSLPVQRVDPQVNKVEQVSSDDHQMSVEGEGGGPKGYVRGCVCSGEGVTMWPIPWYIWCYLPHSEQNDRQMPMKTLPSCNYCCGR